ncbi:MAG: NADP-dependent isocitrate dehydrogenase [Chlamydiae bacterium]|nr:NADP-dependent isocitrate dehydrogenase [Chlamydiota bacterium]
MTSRKIPISVAYGDGIGPEIMEATLLILKEAGANFAFHVVEIGEKVYLKGHPTGIESSTWDIIRNTKAFLKAPITTPQGGGFKSLNVTVRTTLGLFANVRPCSSYYPFVDTKHPKMDLVIVRENEEDLYTGIEYQQTPQVCESIKIISRPGSEKIIRYAFEYARHHRRKTVTCFTKDNIMKFSDGLFHKVFDEIAIEYPDITKEHWIVDIGAAKLADTPEVFEVIVLPNLYGDILSDVAAQISGSIGMGGSANIGDFGCMFEAIHGSAPKRAGQNVANPSGLIQASILMLLHLGEIEIAERIHNAWLCTIEAGIHTYDIYKEGKSKKKVGTKEFALAVCKFLGKKPSKLKPASYKSSEKFTMAIPSHTPPEPKRELVGIDLFLYSKLDKEKLQSQLLHLKTPLKLTMITNRGVRTWPEGQPETFCIEQWRCRYMHKEKSHPVNPKQLPETWQALLDHGFDVIKAENLYLIDKKAGFSSAEG